jgi:hypothetical protein
MDLFNDSVTAQYWQSLFDKVHAGQIDTWDYQWMYSCWTQRGLTVRPSVNLVTNIGHDNRATHTIDPKDALANLLSLAMEFPLRHPLSMIRDFAADRYDTRHVFGVKRGQTVNWSAQARALLRSGYRQIPDSIRRVIARL